MRRRTVFATPFVVVIGCSQPAPQPTAAPHANVDDARPEAASVADAPVAIVHAVPDEPPTDPTPTNCVSRPGGRTCNPPEVRIVKKILDAKVINHDRVEGGLMFVAMLDKSDEITTRFTGVFIDEHGGPIQGTEFAIKNPRKQYIMCLLSGRDQLPSTRVRFYEPGAPR